MREWSTSMQERDATVHRHRERLRSAHAAEPGRHCVEAASTFTFNDRQRVF